MLRYHQAASMYTAARIMITTITVVNMLGPEVASYFWSSDIVELGSIRPILYFGITFSVAFLE